MNLKRWFAWFCLALMLVAEILLYRANRQCDVALLELSATQKVNRDLTAQLEVLTNSNAGLQAAEIFRLRKQNEMLTAKNAALQSEAEAWRQENTHTTSRLTTARTALQLQQNHLQELAVENQLVRTAAEQNNVEAERALCIGALRQIDATKQQWALENDKNAEAIPLARELLPYLKDRIFPVCPSGGTYSINAVNLLPSCNVPGHQLP